MRTQAITESIRSAALPLSSAGDLDPLIEAIGDSCFVLLGEATHGTSEFYEWRCEITRRLIEERGFSFVAVEGDWPDCYLINEFVKGAWSRGDDAEGALHAFERWPTWMWANREVAQLLAWMREHNREQPDGRRAGFYGLDVYSLWESMDAVVGYLSEVDPALAGEARQAYACFDPYGHDALEYARATRLVPLSCEDEVVGVLRHLRGRAPVRDGDPEAHFVAEQNALVARNAERYYRAMIRGGAESWNVRDTHMAETLDRLVRHHGPGAKAIVWAHNTHIGDARFTDMARAGMVNLGELVRRAHYREGVVLVGLGTHRGTVIAAEEWGAPMQRMPVPAARKDSIEHRLHEALGTDAILLFDGSDDGGVRGLDAVIPHRAIGVVYRPGGERLGNYVPTVLPRRYDAFLHVDESRAVDPLHQPAFLEEMPETYPTGM